MKLISEATDEKRRGAFYTPKPIADFILRWGINGSIDADIFEPSCGDGIFLNSLQSGNFEFNSLEAVELIEEEAEKARNIELQNANVYQADFFDFFFKADKRYNLIVGNPPFIRYQFFDKQVEAERIFKQAGLKYSKLTNPWVSFVVGSSLLLTENGKLGFVLPAEILQVSYAQQLRTYLARFFNKINIISFEKLVFPNIQQEVVILLCEKNNTHDHLIEHIEIKNLECLRDLDMYQLKNPQKKIDFKSNKWTFYFLNQTEIDFLENIQTRRRIRLLGDYARVEVGITTGANSYFTVPTSVVNEYKLTDYAKPMVGRSVQVNSVIFTYEDWELNKNSKARSNLLVFPKIDRNKLNGVSKYIELGEQQKVHEGYKTGIRDHWYVIPSIKISDALFIRRNNLYPRLIVNQAKAYTTDTMHRVYLKPGTKMDSFVASYYNSLSLAFTEVSGRSHGGGVLELMPNETEKVLLPYNESNCELLPLIDQMIREKKDIVEVLEVTDRIILKQNYNFTDEEIELAQGIWAKLSSRRLNRGK